MAQRDATLRWKTAGWRLVYLGWTGAFIRERFLRNWAQSSYFKGNRHPTCRQRFVDACEDEKRQDGVCAGFQGRSHLRPCAGGSRWGCSSTSCKVEFRPPSRISRGRSPKIDISLKSHIWLWWVFNVGERSRVSRRERFRQLWHPTSLCGNPEQLHTSLYKAAYTKRRPAASKHNCRARPVAPAWEAAVSNLATRCKDADPLNAETAQLSLLLACNRFGYCRWPTGFMNLMY